MTLNYENNLKVIFSPKYIHFYNLVVFEDEELHSKIA